MHIVIWTFIDLHRYQGGCTLLMFVAVHWKCFVSTTFGTVGGGLDVFTGNGYNIWVIVYSILVFSYPAQRSWRGGYTGFTLSVCPSVRLSVRPSVRLSVCRRHGFWSISQVCFGISISNFICMLMVAIGRSLLIFSDVTFKMAAWRPFWIFWFPDSNFTLALNINFKLQRHNTYVYG